MRHLFATALCLGLLLGGKVWSCTWIPKMWAVQEHPVEIEYWAVYMDCRWIDRSIPVWAGDIT